MASDHLERARAAHQQCEWATAFEILHGLHEDGTPLEADDLSRLADSAFWLGEYDTCISARERAFANYLTGGDHEAASGSALDLCIDHLWRGRMAVGVGWAERAQELLADRAPSVARARLEDLEGLADFMDGNTESATHHFQSAADMSRSLGHAGTAALAAMHLGMLLTRTGDVRGGLRLIDRAMTAAVAGELDPIATARVFCGSISLCQALGDVRRAREWADEVARCSTHPGVRDFPGDCRLHRAELTRLSGDWDSAQREVERAIPELERWDLAHVADAWYVRGDILRLRGDFDAAADSYDHAASMGKNPQPGFALLHSLRGEYNTAIEMLNAALATVNTDPPLEAQLLAALVEVFHACGDNARACPHVTRLDELAREFGTVAVQASSAHARCLVSPTDTAVAAGRHAVALWRDASAPYEAALAQVALADACSRTGATTVARSELTSALATFTALGARPDIRRAQQLLARLSTITSGQRVRRVFMFTDVVDSTRLVAAMGDDAWANVLRWHDRTIRELFDQHAGHEVKQRGGGDGFFAVFTDATSAVECASAIQRAFAHHRDTHGFAPHVRIGVHQADALQHAGDYSGRGVHEAARIAELAHADEITCTASTAADAAAIVRGESESTTLRGLADPVDLVRIEWS